MDFITYDEKTKNLVTGSGSKYIRIFLDNLKKDNLKKKIKKIWTILV